jgi:hypothetical protein
MKFSTALQAETDETFRAHFLRYNTLKDILRAVTPAGAEADDTQNYIRTAINRRLTPNLREASAVRHSFLCRGSYAVMLILLIHVRSTRRWPLPFPRCGSLWT